MDLAEPNPFKEWLSDKSWNNILALCELDSFKDFKAQFKANGSKYAGILSSTSPMDLIHTLLGDKIDLFKKLCVLRCFRLDVIIPGYSLTHYSRVYSLTHGLTYSLTYSLAYSLAYSLTHLLTHSLTHLLTHALTHVLTYSLTHLLTHSPTYSLTYLLTCYSNSTIYFEGNDHQVHRTTSIRHEVLLC